MTGAQHKIVGIGWGLTASYLAIKSGEPLGSLYAFTAIAGSLLPDIDHDRTKLGRKRKVVTGFLGKALDTIITICIIAIIIAIVVSLFLGITLVSDIRVLCALLASIAIFAICRNIFVNSDTYKWAAKHRGLMHTLVVPGIMIASLRILESFLYHGMTGLTIGYISHLFADMCTKQGIPLLWPFTEENIHLTNITTDSKACNVLAGFVACLPILIVIVMGGLKWK